MGGDVTSVESVDYSEAYGWSSEPLSVADREEVSRGVSAGRSGRDIAEGIGRHDWV